MKKLVNLNGGEIFAIPLFLSDISDLTSFARDKFETQGGNFAFCRVIADEQGGGFLIEVFDLIGTLSQDLNTIINSNRLFRPVAITGLGIYKKRWKKIHIQENYDKEKCSQYSEIYLVTGTEDNFQLWKGGKDAGFISNKEAEKYEMWTVWRAGHLEQRIIKELKINETT